MSTQEVIAMMATAVEVFTASDATNLEHDINEWMTDPAAHAGIISIQYSVAQNKHYCLYSALIHYKIREG